MKEKLNGVVGVGSSNLPAPTNKVKGLGEQPKPFSFADHQADTGMQRATDL